MDLVLTSFFEVFPKQYLLLLVSFVIFAIMVRSIYSYFID